MQFLSLLLSLFMITTGYSQEQKEINEQVWKPFTKAIMTQDYEAFIRLHAHDVMRVERDSKKIFNYDTYLANMKASWPGWKKQMTEKRESYVFELRFTERLATATQAFEVGYFKNEITTPDGKKMVSYGKFQVALRKDQGVWKIVVDSDTSEGEAITNATFLAAQALE